MEKFNNNIKTLAPRINTANNATVGLNKPTFGLDINLGLSATFGVTFALNATLGIATVGLVAYGTGQIYINTMLNSEIVLFYIAYCRLRGSVNFNLSQTNA